MIFYLKVRHIASGIVFLFYIFTHNCSILSDTLVGRRAITAKKIWQLQFLKFPICITLKKKKNFAIYQLVAEFSHNPF